MSRTKQISLCGVLAALSIALMFLGSAIWVLSYVMPLVTGLMMLILINNASKKSAWLLYSVVSVISVLLLTDKECALMYAFFFGYYPIIKDNLDAIKIKPIGFTTGFVIFNAGIVSSQLICIYAFGIPFDNMFGKWGIVILLLLANILFIVYKRLLTILQTLYMKKYYKKVKRLLK